MAISSEYSTLRFSLYKFKMAAPEEENQMTRDSNSYLLCLCKTISWCGMKKINFFPYPLSLYLFNDYLSRVESPKNASGCHRMNGIFCEPTILPYCVFPAGIGTRTYTCFPDWPRPYITPLRTIFSSRLPAIGQFHVDIDSLPHYEGNTAHGIFLVVVEYSPRFLDSNETEHFMNIISIRNSVNFIESWY